VAVQSERGCGAGTWQLSRDFVRTWASVWLLAALPPGPPGAFDRIGRTWLSSPSRSRRPPAATLENGAGSRLTSVVRCSGSYPPTEEGAGPRHRSATAVEKKYRDCGRKIIFIFIHRAGGGNVVAGLGDREASSGRSPLVHPRE